MNVESIVLILIFIFPGAFSKLLLSKFANCNQDRKGYVEICEYITISFFTLLLNFFYINNFTNIEMLQNNITDTISENYSLEFLLKYFTLTILSTCLVTILLWLFNRYIFEGIMSLVSGYKHQYGYSLYESMFTAQTLDFKLSETPYIEIIKDKQIIESGLVSAVNGNPNNKPEFVLKYCYEIKKFIDDDSKVKESDRIFTEYTSYCDIKNGIVIRIYDMKKYNEINKN